MKKYRLGFVALILFLVLSLLALPSLSARAASTFTVTPASTDWGFVNDNGTIGDWVTGFENGPGTPPLGVGSFYIQLNSATAGIVFGTQKYQGILLSAITELSYSTYTNLSPAAMAFQINYDPDATTVEASTWYGRLVYEPYQNDTVTNGVWQTWDTIDGGAGMWWASPNGNSTVDTTCPQASPCTWTALITAYPNIGVRNDALSFIQFKAGSNWNGFDGNVDNFTFETGGNMDVYNFELPATVYVDDDWVGTLPGSDPDGVGPATSFGADAFAVIQDGINSVASGGTVQVYAGTYAEDLLINRPLSLLGPNAAVNPNTGVRVAEAVLIPATSGPDPYGTCEVMAYLSVSNVTISGFTFDGDNPSLTSGIMIGSADVDACEILAGYEGMGNISVENNILRHSTYSGIDFYNYYNSAATSNNYIRYNLIENIGETTYNWGIGVLVYNNFYADITNNVLNNVRVGVQTGNFEKVNPGATGSISSNTINAWRLGIFHNLWYSNASTITVSNNTITAISSAGSTKWLGMLISSFQGTTNTIISNNTIIIGVITQNPASGYVVWNTPTFAALTISGGSVTGGNYGIWVNNFEGYSSNADNTSIVVDGVAISGAITAGIYVSDSASNTNGSTVYADILNSTINNSTTGILLSGSDATARANLNQITNNATAGVTNTSGNVMDAEDNWWGSNHGPNDPVGTIEVPVVPEPSVGNMLNAAPSGLLGDSVSNDVDYYPFKSNAPIALSPSPLNFGSQLVGTTSAAQTVTLTNIGAVDLSLGTFGLSSEFLLSNDTCSGQIIAPAGTCTIDVAFSPLTIGLKSGSVTIPSDAVSSPDSLGLNGTGVIATTVSFTSIGNYDGTILESSENSSVGGSANTSGPTLSVGDGTHDRQYLSVLHFDTSNLPDGAVITGITLKLKRQGTAGTNPFNTHGSLQVDVVMPFFGASKNLSASDFQATAGAVNVGVFNPTPASGNWFSALLNSPAFSFLNLTGSTQFRLAFSLDDNDDNGADYLRFYSGNYRSVSYRPQLVVSYFIP